MKNPYEVLRQKEAEMERLEMEVAALKVVIAMLRENSDTEQVLP